MGRNQWYHVGVGEFSAHFRLVSLGSVDVRWGLLKRRVLLGLPLVGSSWVEPPAGVNSLHWNCQGRPLVQKVAYALFFFFFIWATLKNGKIMRKHLQSTTLGNVASVGCSHMRRLYSTEQLDSNILPPQARLLQECPSLGVSVQLQE